MEHFTNHQPPITNHQSPITSYGHDEINLLDYWKVILKHKKTIVGIVAAASVLAVVSSLLMTKTYKAEALIVPVSSKGGGGGMAALAGQFGGLAQLAGINLPGGDDASKMVAMLKSRTLTENVINSQNLMPVLFPKAWDFKKGTWKSDNPKKQPNMERAVVMMKTLVTVMDDKKNKTIKISGEFKDPQVAARVVNGYLEELQNFISGNSFTTAKRNRIFIEGQLEENKQDLLEAGKEINEYYTRGRVSSSEAKVDVPIAKKAVTRDSGLVTRGQNQLADDASQPLMAMNETAEKTNGASGGGLPVTSDESRVTSNGDARLDGLLIQKADVEKKIAEARVVPNVPQQVYLSYLMLRRELLGKVNALLTTQYEMAKIEETKEDLTFQVIDKAVPPVKKFKPKRGQICIMAFMASLFAAVFLAFFREYLERMKTVEAARRNL